MQSELKKDADEGLDLADAPDLSLEAQLSEHPSPTNESKEEAVAGTFKNNADIVNNELTVKNAVSGHEGDNLAHENTENLKRSIEQED